MNFVFYHSMLCELFGFLILLYYFCMGASCMFSSDLWLVHTWNKLGTFVFANTKFDDTQSCSCFVSLPSPDNAAFLLLQLEDKAWVKYWRMIIIAPYVLLTVDAYVSLFVLLCLLTNTLVRTLVTLVWEAYYDGYFVYNLTSVCCI